jgi:hypothetical protein
MTRRAPELILIEWLVVIVGPFVAQGVYHCATRSTPRQETVHERLTREMRELAWAEEVRRASNPPTTAQPLRVDLAPVRVPAGFSLRNCECSQPAHASADGVSQ